MKLRSLLFVPGDRDERFVKAADTGTDAIILDLEDAVTPSLKPKARSAISDFLRNRSGGPRIFVRVNPIDCAYFSDDLAALADTRPDGIVLPKANGAATIRSFDDAMRSRGLAGDIPLLPIATEVPTAIFQLGTYGEVAGRLLGLTWGAEDLPAAIGARTSREEDGSYTAPYEMARSLTLFAAHAANTMAIETVYPAFRDLEGLRRYALRAARDGFNAMMAIHPTQVAIINEAFTPSEEERARAAAIVKAFAAAPDAGAVQLDGKMLDAPHLAQARRILQLGE